MITAKEAQEKSQNPKADKILTHVFAVISRHIEGRAKYGGKTTIIDEEKIYKYFRLRDYIFSDVDALWNDMRPQIIAKLIESGYDVDEGFKCLIISWGAI